MSILVGMDIIVHIMCTYKCKKLPYIIDNCLLKLLVRTFGTKVLIEGKYFGFKGLVGNASFILQAF